MKLLILAPTQIRGVDVSVGQVVEVSNNDDAYTLLECRKATRDPIRIAAREAELSSPVKSEHPEVETATAAPAAETAARNPARRPKSASAA